MNNLNLEDPAGRTNSIPGAPSAVSGNPNALLQPPQRLSSASSYADLHYLFAAQDVTMIAPKPSRNRRKSTQGPDHTKHRRTRSGCYTCRSRRVKVFPYALYNATVLINNPVRRSSPYLRKMQKRQPRMRVSGGPDILESIWQFLFKDNAKHEP